MWIAKWDDKLRGKEKYVWVSDTSPMKQQREMEKFEKARELEKNFSKIENHILKNLDSEDIKKRKIATVCYLINATSMRVGDEKDEDEADTVGATTLTPKNIVIKEDDIVNFNFLGKDSVKWDKDIKLPANVIRNLKEFMTASKDFVFDGVRSDDVNGFLSEIVDDVTAKVFRTYHATKAVREYIDKKNVKKDDPESYKKYVAAMANLQAAIVCNHKRKLPKKWKESLEKKQERLKQLKEKRGKKTEERVKEAKLKIELMKETKDYNLNTSLKSYVDPKVFYMWAKKVGFDWKKYYSKTLQKKFSWIENEKCEEKS
jgi:DNA topoisomerase-1